MDDQDDQVIDEWIDWLMVACAVACVAIIMCLMVLFDAWF